MNVTHWPPSALPLNCTTGTPFLLAATMDAEDAFRLAASKARQLTPCASILSTFFSSFSVSLKASVSRHFTPRALHAACAAFWRAATYGNARFWYDTPKVHGCAAVAEIVAPAPTVNNTTEIISTNTLSIISCLLGEESPNPDRSERRPHLLSTSRGEPSPASRVSTLSAAARRRATPRL